MLQELIQSKHAIQETTGEQCILAKPQIFALRQPSSAACTGCRGARHQNTALQAWQPDQGTVMHFSDMATNTFFLARAVA